MTENEIIAYLRLQRIPGLGPAGAKKLLGLAGSIAAVFEDPFFPARVRLHPSLEEGLRNEGHLRAAVAEFAYARQAGMECLVFMGPGYPHNLAQCMDAPLVLFSRGRISLENKHILAVVGTRAMTGYGRRFCEEFIAGIAACDPVIVSGLAYGVDVCAQEAALAHGLQTIACMAHGLDTVYPGVHSGLAPQIMEHGGFVSEFWRGTAPEPHHFLKRNRIIAGLSQATVVIESAARGGSLVTADLAFGYNREVFAVPGRAGDLCSEGCNGLISQQKAQLLTSAAQFLQAMQWGAASSRPEREPFRIPGHWSEAERIMATYLREHPEPTLDELVRDCRLTVQQAVTALFELELQGFVRPIPGKRYLWSG